MLVHDPSPLRSGSAPSTLRLPRPRALAGARLAGNATAFSRGAPRRRSHRRHATARAPRRAMRSRRSARFRRSPHRGATCPVRASATPAPRWATGSSLLPVSARALPKAARAAREWGQASWGSIHPVPHQRLVGARQRQRQRPHRVDGGHGTIPLRHTSGADRAPPAHEELRGRQRHRPREITTCHSVRRAPTSAPKARWSAHCGGCGSAAMAGARIGGDHSRSTAAMPAPASRASPRSQWPAAVHPRKHADPCHRDHDMGHHAGERPGAVPASRQECPGGPSGRERVTACHQGVDSGRHAAQHACHHRGPTTWYADGVDGGGIAPLARPIGAGSRGTGPPGPVPLDAWSAVGGRRHSDSARATAAAASTRPLP